MNRMTPEAHADLCAAVRYSHLSLRACRDCTALGYHITSAPDADWPTTEACAPCAGKGFFKLTAEEMAKVVLPADWPVKLTQAQKLEAMALRYYSGCLWGIDGVVRAGDLYTSSRADLELYQVVAVEDGKVVTRYRDPRNAAARASWDYDDFLSPKSFGRCRVWVPNWIVLT